MSIRNEFKAGAFVVVALGLFILSVLTIGQERQIFATQVSYQAVFSDVKGLSVGAPVRLGGIAVGRVSQLGFSTALTNPEVEVTLMVNENYASRIRADAVATIETQGLLGDRLVVISPGAAPSTLKPGAEMGTSEPADLSEVLDKAAIVVDNTVRISDQVNKAISDFRDKSLEDLQTGLSSLASITKEIRDGTGLMHKLIYSEKEGDRILERVGAISKNLDDIIREVREGDGLLHALIFDPSGKRTVDAITAAAKGLADTSTRISELAREIEEGEGTLHSLIYSETPDDFSKTLEKLHRAAANLEKASQALADGSGTLGALLVDPTLYENLVEVTDDAKRSFILREAIQASLDK